MDFEVLILGSDINAYYMARNCYEQYHKKAHLIGMTPMNFTSLSNILEITYVKDSHDFNIVKDEMMKFYEENKDKKILLVPSNDNYVRLMQENQDFLKQYFVFHTISVDLLNDLLVKDRFYRRFADKNIPKTYIYNIEDELDLNRVNELGYELILKPGDGIEYHEHEFVGQAKVFKIFSEEELLNVIKKIKDSGYKGNLILQEFIEGDDSYLFDCISYCDKNGKVKLMSFAQIALQEHTITGIGNCTVLVNGFNEYNNTKETVEELKEFLESLNYHGICEFDLKYDKKSQKFKILEINPRQARSSYYLTACGYNLVKYLVDELIYGKEFDFHFIDEKMVLSFVPMKVIKENVNNEKIKKEIINLKKQKKYCDPLNCTEDKHLKRKMWLFLRKINFVRKYRKCKW